MNRLGPENGKAKQNSKHWINTRSTLVTARMKAHKVPRGTGKQREKH